MLQQVRTVDGALRGELARMLESCAASDGYLQVVYTDASVNLHPEMDCAFAIREAGRLAGFLFAFAPSAEEAEFTAIVHPGYRRRGLFTKLFAAAQAACRAHGYTQGLFCVDGRALHTQAVAAHLGMPLSHIEYQMELALPDGPTPDAEGFALRKLTEQDIPTVIPAMALCFGNEPAEEEAYLRNCLASADRTNWLMTDQSGAVLGYLGEYRDEKGLNLFGIGVPQPHRGKGYGKRLLDLAAGLAKAGGIQKLLLDVNSANEPALRLYRGYGFAACSETRYYTMVIQ